MPTDAASKPPAGRNDTGHGSRLLSSRLLFGPAVFLGAFLLFQVQLIEAKRLLPWFGGSSSVWATCMLLYQALLLGGYWAAHLLAGRPMRRQAVLHLGFLACAAVALAVMRVVDGTWVLPGGPLKPLPGAEPIGGILLTLGATIGLPFLVLAMTAPLLQAWFARLRAGRGGSPYFLYAVSNAGSLLGLLTYPSLFEPALRLGTQGAVWAALFALFLLCCAGSAWSARGGDAAAEVPTRLAVAPRERALWFALSACGSVMLLATTTLMTQDLAPVPMLWMLPLAVYLLTFVLVFLPRNLYRPGIFHPLFAAAGIMATTALYRGSGMGVPSQVGVFLFALFVVCMTLHGELARRKPGPAALTSYYLTLAAGGAAGGLLVSVAAPLLLPAIWEYHIGLAAAAGLAALMLALDRESWLHHPRPSPAVPLALLLAVASVPRYLVATGVAEAEKGPLATYTAALAAGALLLVLMLLSGGPRVLRRRDLYWHHLSVVAALGLLVTALAWNLDDRDGVIVHRTRNFYAALTVREQASGGVAWVELRHGRIVHGLQLQGAPRSPTTYYDPRSGVGVALLNHPQRGKGPLRVGVIGLGAGVLAAYARPEDTFRFYEINPAVIRLARGEGGYFRFLRDAPSSVETVQGDARLSLERELSERGGQGFDLLVVDAFSGDSIPVHLLTKEAFELYLRHLSGPGAVIAVHVSNLNVDLKPVMAGIAGELGMDALLVDTEERGPTLLASHWVLLCRGRTLQIPEIHRNGMLLARAATQERPPLWTDDHNNVLLLLDRRR